MKMHNHRIPGTALAATGLLLALAGGCEFDNEISGPGDNALTVSPEAVRLDARLTNIVEFSATGGSGSYTWSLSESSLGALYLTTTNTAVILYQSTTNTGTNLLTARDPDNNSANARIIQQ